MESVGHLWKLYTRYHYATEILAFPRPDGFASFHTWLGFNVLTYPQFLQYTQRGVLQLNVDVMRKIMTGTGEKILHPFKQLKFFTQTFLN